MLIVAAWQGLQNDSISAGNTRLLMIFVGIVALSMLTQAIVVVLMAIGAKKAQERIVTLIEEMKVKAMPVLHKSEELLSETGPKIKTITDNLVHTSDLVRAKAQELDATISDANTRTKAQVARVDSMISTALTATGTLAAMIHHGIRTPVAEAVGVVNGFKAGIDVLLSKSGASGKSKQGTGWLKSKSKAITLYKGDEE